MEQSNLMNKKGKMGHTVDAEIKLKINAIVTNIT